MSPTYVYFISAGYAPTKIGLSDNPQQRLSELQTAHYKDLHLLFTIECDSRTKAFEIESGLHQLLEGKHIINEWYDLSVKQASKLFQLIANISTTTCEARQIADVDEFQGIIENHNNRVVTRIARVRDATAIVQSHLELYPEDVNLSCRELAEKLSVGKATANKVQRLIRLGV